MLIEEIKKFVINTDLTSTQKKSLDYFLDNGFPTTKDEDWKYTSLKKVLKRKYCLKSSDFELNDEMIQQYSLGFKDKIIFKNGKIYSKPKILGVSINKTRDLSMPKNSALCYLNEAICENTYEIIFDKNLNLDNPIEILHFINNDKDYFLQLRTKITCGSGSIVKLVERFCNIGKNTLINSCMHVDVKRNSFFEISKLQSYNDNTHTIDNTLVDQDRDSTANVHTFSFDGSFIRNNLNFYQNNENCTSNMNGITIIDKSNFVDHHTFVDHKFQNCLSNESYKGVYFDNTKGVFNGKIMVRPDAQKINAFQSNNNLLFSDNASIKTKPQLEIYADDVKCSHGCTIGQIDKKALFYMRSRGFSEKTAKGLLTFAFLIEVVEKLSTKEIVDYAKTEIAKKLSIEKDLL